MKYSHPPICVFVFFYLWTGGGANKSRIRSSCLCFFELLLYLAPDRKPPDDDIVFASKRRNRDIWEAALVISFNYRKTKRQRILAFCQLRSGKNFLFDSLPNPNCKTKCFDNQTYSIQLDIVFQNLASVNSKPIL